MSDDSSLRTLGAVNRESVADQVFNQLYHGVISLELRPGAKLSEVEVSKAMGVSRQPVRDAFYRLSKLGFLDIRPQRATLVSKISERAVMQARFIRTALEIESIRVACEKLTDSDMDALADILRQQEKAVELIDKMVFHELDDQFHREICERAGVGFIWKLIQENKAHMDRVRFLSLSFATLRAYDDHIRMFEALRQRDVEESVKQMRTHLSAILEHFSRIRAEHLIYFAQEDKPATP